MIEPLKTGSISPIKYLILIWLLFILGIPVLVSCQDDSDDVAGIKLPNPTEAEEKENMEKARTIVGVFALGNTSDSQENRVFRLIEGVDVTVIDSNGELLTSTQTDNQGNFELTVSVAEDALPLTLQSIESGVTYTSAIAALDTTITSHINEITTAIAEEFATRSNQGTGTLETVTKLVLINRFGINNEGNPNIPEDTFTSGDFTTPDSLGNLILDTAANTGISLLNETPTDEPLLANQEFLETFTSELRSLEDASTVLETIDQQSGSATLVQNLTNAVEASDNELNEALNQIKDDVQTTLEEQQDAVQELEQQLEQLEEQAASSDAQVTSESTSTNTESDSTADESTNSDTITETGNSSEAENNGNTATTTTTSTTSTTTLISANTTTSTTTTTTTSTSTTTTTLTTNVNTTTSTTTTTTTTSTSTTTTTLSSSSSNNTPSDIQLSNTSVAENQTSGTTVGTLSTTDADSGDTHTYSLVSGTGSTNNASFSIDGSTLKTAASFDYETQSSYSIRVQTTDNNSASYEEALTITISNTDESPASVTTLATTNATETTIGLTWTAVGEDESTGTASSYEIRYSTSDITSDSLCDSATELSNSITPQTSGSSESTTVTVTSGLSGVQYYFCIRAVDGSGNKGSWSSSGVTATTTATLTHTDISTGQGSNSGYNPDIVIDTVNSKLLVVTENRDNNTKLSLFRCDLDGTDCTHTDISAGQGTYSGEVPSIAIDTGNSKLVAITQNSNNNDHPALFRCDLDGSNCTYTDIAAGQGTLSGITPSVAIDTHNSKILAVTKNGENSYKPALFRCDLDGSNCTYTDISSGQGMNSGEDPVIIFDSETVSASTNILVITDNVILTGVPGLFKCDLSVSSCGHTNLASGLGLGNWVSRTPSAAIDHVNSKLLVVTKNDDNSSKLALFRCDTDGTNCTYTDISTSQGSNSGQNPSLAIDTTNSKLLVATQNGANNEKLSLFRCDLDGTDCTHTDISVSQGNNSGENPKMVIDTVNSYILIVTQNGDNSYKPSLYRLPLDF